MLELAPAELLHRSKLYAMSLLTAHSSTFFLCCVRAVEVHSWEMQAVGTEIIPIHPSPRGRFAKHLHRVLRAESRRPFWDTLDRRAAVKQPVKERWGKATDLIITNFHTGGAFALCLVYQVCITAPLSHCAEALTVA